MKIVRMTDNTINVSPQQIECIPNLKAKLVNKTFDQLEKDGILVFPKIVKEIEDIDSTQMVLQKTNNIYKTSNVVGFLGCKDERLTISSRFTQEKGDYFFQYLLQKVINFPNVFELETNTNSNNQLLDILAFLFPKFLKNAMRKGIFKTYIRNEYNNSNVKGTINVARHIKQNTPFVGNIAYSQREYSYDNFLTELIRHTIEFIKGKSYGKKILAMANTEVKNIVEVTQKYRRNDLRKILIQNKKNVIRHAYFTEYCELQRLCILILQSQKQEIGFGISHVYGILFDAAWLWEEYINTLVKDKFYHPKNKAHEGAHWLFSKDERRGLVYPDFIGRDANNRIIADAKYKPQKNIGRNDYFQILAYMFRFNAKQGYFFYPEKVQTGDITLYLNEGSRYDTGETPRDDTIIKKYGFKVPQNVKDFKEFCEAMKNSEKDFLEKISLI